MNKWMTKFACFIQQILLFYDFFAVFHVIIFEVANFIWISFERNIMEQKKNRKKRKELRKENFKNELKYMVRI